LALQDDFILGQFDVIFQRKLEALCLYWPRGFYLALPGKLEAFWALVLPWE
jgi:hypothetical protein